MMKQRKMLAAVAAVCGLALTFAGCGSGASQSSNASTGGKDIITAFGLEPVNPLVAGNTNEPAGGRAVVLLYTGLVSFDAKGNPRNDDAESITPDATGTTYTVKLKKGLKFSDGSPITARSYTRAWSYVANATNAQKNASFFSSIKGYDDLQKSGLKGDEQLEGLNIVDNRTFTVELNRPDATFPIKVGYFGFAPLADSFYKGPKAFGEHPVTNGPYKLKQWDHDSSITTVKDPNYTGPNKAKNDGVTLKIYTKDEAAYSDVQAGNLDVMDSVPAADTKTFRTDSSVQAFNEPGSLIQMFTIPSGLAHYKNGTEEGTLRRQAISLAIDRKALVNKVMNGVGEVPTDFTSPLTPGYNPNLKGKENLAYNPSKAKELWAEANAISKDTDTLTISYNADNGNKALYDAIVNSINNTLGSNVAKVNAVPTYTEFHTSIADRKMTGAFRSGWQPDYPSAENYLYQVFDSEAANGNGSNEGDYHNPEFDKLMDEAYAAKSSDEANAIYAKSQEILLRDLPAFPLFYANNAGVAAKGVKGFAINWQTFPTYTQITKQ